MKNTLVRSYSSSAAKRSRTRLGFIIIAGLALAACGDKLQTATEPDAGLSCCRFYPDVDAVNACAALPAGACGRMRCDLGDGSGVDIPVCGPARVDGGSL